VDKHPPKYYKRPKFAYPESEPSDDEGRRIPPQASPYSKRRMPKSSKEKFIDEVGRAKLAEEMKLLYFDIFEELYYHGAKSKDELWEAVAHHVKVYNFPKADLDNPYWIHNTLLRTINTVDLAEWRAAGLKRRYWEPQIFRLYIDYHGDSTDAYEPGDLSSSVDNDDGDEGKVKGEDEISSAKVTVEISKSKGEIESGESQ
jgi:hypothetical protein